MTQKHLIFLVCCLFLSALVSGCASEGRKSSDNPAHFSFTRYGNNQIPLRELNVQLAHLGNRQEIETLLVTQGGARKEVFDNGIVFYIYESSAPVLKWAIITKVRYSEEGRPLSRIAVRDNVPHLVSPAENPQQFLIAPWVTYGGGYGKEKLNTILKEMFPVGASCADVGRRLQSSGDMNKTRRQRAKNAEHEFFETYKDVVLLVAGWEYGISYSCDKHGTLQTPPTSFARYTGI